MAIPSIGWWPVVAVPDASLFGPSFPHLVARLGAVFLRMVASPAFTSIGVPILLTYGAMLLKRYARPKAIRTTDEVVGFDLGIIACGTLLISGCLLVAGRSVFTTDAERQSYLIGLFIMLLIFLIVLGVGAARMNSQGWEPPSDNPRVKGNWQMGVNAGGVVMLVTAFVLAGGTF